MSTVSIAGLPNAIGRTGNQCGPSGQSAFSHRQPPYFAAWVKGRQTLSNPSTCATRPSPTQAATL